MSFRLTDAPERRLRLHGFPKVAFRDACRVNPSVSTMPGFTALTRMPRGPNSLASDLVTAFTAALVAL
jgi:hypothetical protein